MSVQLRRQLNGSPSQIANGPAPASPAWAATPDGCSSYGGLSFCSSLRLWLPALSESKPEALEDLLHSVGLGVESFASTQEFLQSKRSDAPGCIVLDVRLPGPSGLEFQRTPMKSGVLLPIIFISGHGDISMSVQAIKAGAIDFLTKPLHEQKLLDAIQTGIERDRVRKAEEKDTAQLQKRTDSLTPREQEVLMIVITGRPNKQIAAQLKLSEMTVKIHRSQMMRKMKAKSLVELVRMADLLKISAQDS